MKCMKCGVTIPSGQVFCNDCLADMAAHPVPQDAPLLLPRREKQQPIKRSKKKIRKPEEQIARLRRSVRGLIIALISVTLIGAIAISILVNVVIKSRNTVLPGQNYSTVEKS
jgi:hypothetical protein